MCGFVSWQSDGPVNEQSLRSMADTLKHRGPDDGGTWFNGSQRTGFGHRRLSIIDIEGGQQPMEREGYGINYNGEVYNYRTLRQRLATEGYDFHTDSDTEVVLQGYRHWGFELFDHLRGMFSLSIWDPDREELILARDTAGQKPLFYYDGDDRFLAASELQALLAHDDVARSADYASLSWYLSMGYVPSPRSGFAKIKKLPPGHYMRVKDGTIRDQVRYWDPVSFVKDVEPIPDGDVEDCVRESLRTAVERRMVSDVPLGAFLSGGVDSTLIVGLMREMTQTAPKTVTVGFGNDRYDERDYASHVAETFGTDHREYEVDMDLKEVLPKLVRHFGEPFADSSAVPTFYVSKKTREAVKVALSGDGGDECFGGYRRYDAMRRLGMLNRWTPGFLRRAVGAVGGLFGNPSDRRSSTGELMRIARMIGQSPVIQYLAMVGIQGEDLKRDLAKGPLERPAGRGGDQWLGRVFRRLNELEDPAGRAMMVDLMTYLPGDLLVKTDITSMMNSLEVRCPFLDRDLMETAMRIPSHHKIHGGDKKHVLKAAFRDLIPKRVRNREKMGFGVPLMSWFREGPEAEYLRDVLMAHQSGFFSIIDRYRLERLIEEHRDGNRDASPFLWALVMLKLWMREFDVRV